MTPQSQNPSATGPRGIGRVLAVIRAVAAQPEVALSELATATRIPRTTLFTMMKSLVADGYLEYDRERYSLGPAALELGQLIVNTRSFPSMAMPALQELADQCGETVILSTLSPDRQHNNYEVVLENDNPLRFSLKAGTIRPLNSSAGGRALLAYLPADEREQYIEAGNFTRYTDFTIVDSEGLREEVEIIRKQHYALSIDGSVLGAMAIAAPWFDSRGIVGSVILGAPTARLMDTWPALQPRVSATAEQISRIMGMTGPYPPQ